MNTLRNHIDALDYHDLIALVNDYERFERDGSIGECYLRDTAGHFLLPGFSIVSLMERVAFEAYRALARCYGAMDL